MSGYSPHLEFVDHLEVFREHITRYRKEHDGTLRFLEVGSGDNQRRGLASGFEYESLDNFKKAQHQRDICHWPERDCEEDYYDIVFMYNVLEHVKDPFSAARNCVRLAKIGGLLIAVAPFSWRYHPFPIDMWRFTHTGLAHLFEHGGNVTRLIAAYDIRTRRNDNRGGVLEDLLDVPPIDELGGWRENWNTVYVGQKGEACQR